MDPALVKKEVKKLVAVCEKMPAATATMARPQPPISLDGIVDKALQGKYAGLEIIKVDWKCLVLNEKSRGECTCDTHPNLRASSP